MSQTIKKSTRKVNNAKKTAKKSPMFDTLDRLRRENKLVDNSITFHFPDNTTQIQNINRAFVIDEKNRKRRADEILMDINAITHDLGATHFTID